MQQKIKYRPSVIVTYLLFTAIVIFVWERLFAHQMIWHARWELLAFTIISCIIFYKFTRIAVLGLFGTPAITLTEDYVKLTNSGYQINWKDITNIALTHFTNRGVTTYTILLTIRDEQKYIRQLNDPLMRLYYKYTQKNAVPFKISLSELQGNEQEICSLIERYYWLYRE